MSAILSTQNLVKKYGYIIVSNNISLTINKGDIYGFVGKNGAGKTTFMRQVLGLSVSVYFDTPAVQRLPVPRVIPSAGGLEAPEETASSSKS